MGSHHFAGVPSHPYNGGINENFQIKHISAVCPRLGLLPNLGAGITCLDALNNFKGDPPPLFGPVIFKMLQETGACDTLSSKTHYSLTS